MNRRFLVAVSSPLLLVMACQPAVACATPGPDREPSPPVSSVLGSASNSAGSGSGQRVLPSETGDRQLAPMPSLAPLVRELKPAVVNIYTTREPRLDARRRMPRGEFDDFFNRFFGGRIPQQQQRRQSLGSGFLIGDGLALTNNHVIEGADEIKVKLSEGRELDAEVVGSDPSTDVALLRLKGDGAEDVPSVPLGDSDALEVGDYVVAIGNPFGLAHTVTSGIVSAKERFIGAGPYDDFIQTDASINPGNSGGPLFNLRGEVVGINTAIVAQGQGIGFAVPVNMVKELLPQLRDSGRVSRGWLGVGIQDLTKELARGLDLDVSRGALIAQVFPGGPAEKGGIRSGDVVVEFNGRTVESQLDLTRAVAAATPGSKVKVVVLRDGKRRTLDVVLSERDEGALAEGRLPSSSVEDTAHVGLRVTPLPREFASREGMATSEGLLVESVDPKGAAAVAGVREGDVLLELQRVAMTGMDAFREAAGKVRPGESVLFRVRRGQSVLYLASRAPNGRG